MVARTLRRLPAPVPANPPAYSHTPARPVTEFAEPQARFSALCRGPGRPISATRAGAPASRRPPMSEHGIHHVTAIAGDGPPQPRLLHPRRSACASSRRPSTSTIPAPTTSITATRPGRPGTILTFFPWEHAAPGRLGVGQTQETAFRVPEGSIGYWTHRFVEKGVPHEAPEKRFGETVLPFKDPDGMRPRARRRRPAPRASPPGAAARCRPSTRSAASTASPCCSTTRRRPARS